MRAREILQEDYNANLEADLNNLLIGAKGSGATQLQTQQVVNELQNMGYSVSPVSLMHLLQKNPNVLNATPTMLTLKTSDTVADGNGVSGQDNAAKVGDMAQSATKIG